ncbi:2-dehydropantoate 2-reductase [Paenibacillus baekrokdamisoli]|uniref:2-dehydropantoate 2-reductase n=1 Tax=Paenibacillus baekrokdamisoli TaxID=1712516 RepID=A0A3G9JBJ2_9BACL|nr:2-dehydropantoate 2-reductase [Paenibacillus baekrokdamisoli]BBH21238.1 2-dehydropantoate 2-reductase [Paenibacillus baekrokdamisoli]
MMIVGAGSIGLMYAARLARAGISTTLLTRTTAQAQALREQGITLEEKDITSRISIKAAALDEPFFTSTESPNEGLPNQQDWIWLTVKQPHLDDKLLHHIARLAAGGASVLCLQNGIGHMERLQAVIPPENLYAAVSTEGALRVNETTVKHTGNGLLTFGYWSSQEKEVKKAQKMLLQTLSLAGINRELSNQMGNRVYHKLLINAVINPLTAIYGVRNGELPLNPSRKRLMMALHAESESVLRAAGMQDSENSWERLLTICIQTAGNESSMLRDVSAGRSTEVEWINGGISALAKRLNKPSPLNDAMTILIKSLVI